MESLFIQNIRYKLQKRVRRLHGANADQFLFFLKQFLVFVEGVPLLASIIEELKVRVPDYNEQASRADRQVTIFGESEQESAAIGYGMLRRYAAESHAAKLFNLIGLSDDAERTLECFRTVYLDPLYEYIDEHLDDHSFVLHTLLRYKQSCEWFRRERLHALWEADTARGERHLAFDLYRYLHDNGVEFHIEPSSASGEPDMVSLQAATDDPLIADAKIFNPDRSNGKAYLIRGFHQVYRYTCDYNQPIGYLIVFNTSKKGLRLALRSASEAIPRIVYNHKTVFLVVIDVFPHVMTASKRPVPDVVEIDEDEFRAPSESTTAALGR